MSAVTILGCGCKHKYQDQTYGPGQKVFNLRDKAGKWVCTVCAAQKEGPHIQKTEKPEKGKGKDKK